MTPAAFLLAALIGLQAGMASHEGEVLSLRAAVGEALRASPALLPARDAVEIAAIEKRVVESRFAVRIVPDFLFGSDPGGGRRQQVGVAVARRLPTGAEVSAQTGWMQYGDKGREVRDAGYTLSFTQPLLQAFGPLARAPLLDARRAVAAAERQMEDGRQRLVLRTVDAYFSIVRQQLFAEAAAHALDRAGRLRAASQARARVGLATELDVMRAELLAAQAEAALHAQEEALERARDGLKLLLGRPLSSSIAVDVSAIPQALPAPDADAGPLLAAALEHRLELLEARDRIDDARRAESVARWSLLPDLQFDASYTRRGLGGGGLAAHDLLGGWRVGVRSTYGFDRTTLAASAARAALSAGAAERAATQMEDAVTAEVRAAHGAVRRSHGAIGIHSKALDIAERQAKLARLRYERGLADNVDLVAAEGNVLQARTAMIGAQVDHVLARLALQRASGHLNPGEYMR